MRARRRPKVQQPVGDAEETGAGEVWVTHGQEDALVHWCLTNGIQARPRIAGSVDSCTTLLIDESLAELAGLVEATALQPGEAETAENRGVHGSVERAAERKGPLIELVHSVGSVTLEGHQR